MSLGVVLRAASLARSVAVGMMPTSAMKGDCVVRPLGAG
jgi:hypothetical protein